MRRNAVVLDGHDQRRAIVEEDRSVEAGPVRRCWNDPLAGARKQIEAEYLESGAGALPDATGLHLRDLVPRPCRIRFRQIPDGMAQGQHLVSGKSMSGLPQVLHRISAALFEPAQAELVGYRLQIRVELRLLGR